jgi:hypothetical protein
MNNFITKVKNFWHKLIGDVEHDTQVVETDFSKIVGSEQAAAFKAQAASILKTSLGRIALSVVAGIKSVASNLSDPAKREEAFTQILALVKAQGLIASDSIVHLFIDLAVTYLNNKV